MGLQEPKRLIPVLRVRHPIIAKCPEEGLHEKGLINGVLYIEDSDRIWNLWAQVIGPGSDESWLNLRPVRRRDRRKVRPV